jgi:RNA polymerase-binding transcription factor DksA
MPGPGGATRDVQEILAVERTLKRIALGTYGICVSCGQPYLQLPSSLRYA